MSGTLTCADDNASSSIEWDLYAVVVLPGDCVWISADNAGTGAADLLALALDDLGAVYGLQSDYSQLDDEASCATSPWNGFGCPEAAVTPYVFGNLTIGVAQWGGGCAAGMSDYQLSVTVNGVPTTPGLFEDDLPTADLPLP